MLKVKKHMPFKLTSNNEEEYLKNQNEIKNSIKNLYIGNQSKKKTINEYAQLVTEVHEEYAKLQNKCRNLEETLQKYKDFIEGKWNRASATLRQQQDTRYYRRPIRKRKYTNKRHFDDQYFDDQYEDDADNDDYDDDNDDDNQYVKYKKPKRKIKKRIVYVDEIDGNDDEENDSDNKSDNELEKKPSARSPPPSAKKVKKSNSSGSKAKIGLMRSI